MSTTYRVSQSYEHLGDPSTEVLATRAEAEQYAADLRAVIVSIVMDDWDSEPPSILGDAGEVAVLAHAYDHLCADDGSWTREAAEHIAEQAVTITEMSDDAA